MNVGAHWEIKSTLRLKGGRAFAVAHQHGANRWKMESEIKQYQYGLATISISYVDPEGRSWLSSDPDCKSQYSKYGLNFQYKES